MYDTTVYPLHALTSVLGPALRVTAMSGIRLPARKVTGDRVVQATADDTTLMILDFGDALFASIYGVTYGRVNEGHTVSYFGSAGSIVGRSLNGEPLEYPERLRDASPQAELPHVRGRHRDMPEAHVFEDVMQLVDWVRDGVSTPVTAEHARHVIDIIESAYRSAQHGRTEELTTSFKLEPSAV
ncbi:MAG: hypothetical protein J2P38_10760 [Candidatus Dormibacteraeota bacterium]|nr:hypothetical protein [Candidatus Dormibacteraeota bacterium]